MPFPTPPNIRKCMKTCTVTVSKAISLFQASSVSAGSPAWWWVFCPCSDGTRQSTSTLTATSSRSWTMTSFCSSTSRPSSRRVCCFARSMRTSIGWLSSRFVFHGFYIKGIQLINVLQMVVPIWDRYFYFRSNKANLPVAYRRKQAFTLI